MSPRVVALLAVGVVAVSLSGPVMASLVVGPLAISFWRNALATGLLAPVALARRRTELAGLGRPDLLRIVLAGLALAGHFGFWVTSLTMTSVASSTAIVCLQVIWVVLWDRLTGTRVRSQVLVGVAVAIAGALVVTGVDFSLSTRALVGDLFALIGSISVAAYTILGARARATVSTTTYTFLCYGTAAATLLLLTLVSGQRLVGYDARDWLLLGLVALTAQLLGHSVFNYLLDTISPMVVSLTLLLEIPGAALIAAAFLDQVPGLSAVAGLVLILVGMVVVVTNAPAPPEEAPVA